MTSREDTELATLRAQVQQLSAQLRRVYEELDWAQEQVRVYRRVIERSQAQS